MDKKKFLTILLLIIVFLFFNSAVLANADDLIIQSDGGIILVITGNGVLGESTSKTKEEKKEEKPRAPARTIPLVPARTESIVEVKPPINNDRKVQVTITPGPKTLAPSVPVRTITKTVDQVVAQGANGQPVLTIKSDRATKLIIKQGEAQASTSLPLQINTITHTLSVPSGNESTRISVLPNEALKEVKDKGILDQQGSIKIDLNKDVEGVNYTLLSEKKGKLLGVLDITSSVEVKLSAENGKVIRTSQGPLFGILNGLIR